MHNNDIYIEALNSDKSSPLAIIPAAGLGTRVGSPPAKELLLHPSGERFIDHAIKLAKNLKCSPLIISRKDKHALNEYLIQHQKIHQDINILLIDQTPEWTFSVEKSAPHFRDKNLLVLPDVEWGPISSAQEIINSLSTYEISLGIFQISNPLLWGAIEVKNNILYMAEKPKNSDAHLAWGLIGFQKKFGIHFWHHYKMTSINHEMIAITSHYQLHHLAWFKDLTR